MTYGLQFTNTAGVITLDSEVARLSVMFTGVYSPNADSNLTAIVNFPAPITTQEPPLIFARPTTSAGTAAISSVVVFGSAGNWTGFQIRTRSVNYLQPNGKWFAAIFKSTPAAQYGLRMWDGAGQTVFDNGNQCAVFTRAFQNWTYAFSQQLDIGATNFFEVPFDFPEGEYMLINNFGMSMVGGNPTGRLLGCLWDFSNRKLYATTTSTSNPNTIYLPALFAKLVI
jgi:hypothetical protein